MPDAATTQAEAYNEILATTDFWMHLDQPSRVMKSAAGKPLTYKFINDLDEEVELPIIGGWGSSSLIDGDSDVFHKVAMESIITTAKPKMLTWRNHSFVAPDDNFGYLADILNPDGTYVERGLSLETQLKDAATAAQAQTIAQSYGGQSITVNADFGLIRINSVANTVIPQAETTYKAIVNGSQYGWSIGCMYKNAKRRQDSRGAIRGFDVFAVETKEFSIVSLPSNPLAFVDCARKGMIARGLIPANPDRDPEYGRFLGTKGLETLMRDWGDFDVKKSGELTDDDLEMAAIAVMLRKVGEIGQKHFGIEWAYSPDKRRFY